MKIAIFGNGFDLFHNMKTELSDFLEFLEFKKSKNIWFLYLKRIKPIKKWADFEKEIALVFNFIDINQQNHLRFQKFSLKYWKKNYTNDLNAFIILWNQFFLNSIPMLKSTPNRKTFILENNFHSTNLLADDQGYLIDSFYQRNDVEEVYQRNIDYLIKALNSFKELLIVYFHIQDKKDILMNEKIYKLLFKSNKKTQEYDEYLNEESNYDNQHRITKLLSFNFNYSNKTSDIYFQSFPETLMETKNLYKNFHIYGEINKRNIVFGTNLISRKVNNPKIATLRKEFQGVLKDNLIDMKNIFLNEISEEITEVIILGNSICDTDWWFYKELILLLKFFKSSPEFIILYHNEEEKQEKLINLLILDSVYFTDLSREKKLIWKKYSEFK